MQTCQVVHSFRATHMLRQIDIEAYSQEYTFTFRRATGSWPDTRRQTHRDKHTLSVRPSARGEASARVPILACKPRANWEALLRALRSQSEAWLAVLVCSSALGVRTRAESNGPRTVAPSSVEQTHGRLLHRNARKCRPQPAGKLLPQYVSQSGSATPTLHRHTHAHYMYTTKTSHQGSDYDRKMTKEFACSLAIVISQSSWV